MNRIVLVVGHSGAGKSSLATQLGLHFNCDVLSFSSVGRLLAAEDKESEYFKWLTDDIYNRIISTAMFKELTIVDGLASDRMIQRLKDDHFLVLTMFLDTPYMIRIARMRKRECCSELDAIITEKDKERGKEKSGLLEMIQLADITLDGTKSQEIIRRRAISYVDEFFRGGSENFRTDF